MKATKTILLVAGVLVTLFGPTLQAWAGGTPAGGTPSCLVQNPGSGAIALKATVAVEALNVTKDALGDVQNTAQDVDVTLRVERGSAVGFFRLRLLGIADFLVKSNEEIACLIVDPSNYTAGSNLVNDILTLFGLQYTKTRLLITSKSVSNTDGGNLIDDTGHASAVADVIYYAQ